MIELIEGFHITLNGLNAEVYETPDGILISNNDFSSPDIQYDELYLTRQNFKQRLFKNKGKFTISKEKLYQKVS